MMSSGKLKKNLKMIRPGKLIGKIPMHRIVIDEKGNVFRYIFYKNKIRYIYSGSVCFEKNTFY
jgi:hypothetical protein